MSGDMANLSPTSSNPVAQTEFRYLPNIDELSDAQLKEHGYYRGYVCPHDHNIRDSTHHWCYHCVKKIKNNICGFDLNYLNSNYKHKYYSLWKKIQVSHFDDCWEIKDGFNKSPKRICIPSYRSLYNEQKADNVNIHKAIYQCAWGDIGSMVVTRVCKNNRCGNPLHMVSSWNRLFPPEKIHPFDTTFTAEKLMQYARLELQKQQAKLVESKFKKVITHPLEAPEVPDYDEGG